MGYSYMLLIPRSFIKWHFRQTSCKDVQVTAPNNKDHILLLLTICDIEKQYSLLMSNIWHFIFRQTIQMCYMYNNITLKCQKRVIFVP